MKSPDKEVFYKNTWYFRKTRFFGRQNVTIVAMGVAKKWLKKQIRKDMRTYGTGFRMRVQTDKNTQKYRFMSGL